GKMISNLNVDVVGRDDFFPRPALLDDFDKLCGDVDAPLIIPLSVKPSSELLGRVPVKDIDIQLALIRKARKCQIAATEIPDDRVDLIGSKKKIQLSVRLVSEKKTPDQLSGFQ